MTNLYGRAATVAAVSAVALVASVAPARADTVTDWNANASTAIVVTAGQPPPAAVLSFAMVQGAVYDAVNAIDRGHRPYMPQPAGAPAASEERGGGDCGAQRARIAVPASAGRCWMPNMRRRWPRSRRHP